MPRPTLLLAFLVLGCPLVHAQLDPLTRPAETAPNPLTSATASAGAIELIKLEQAFAADVAKRGGEAFSDWFADDGMELPDGKAPVLGHTAVRNMARWDPHTYQLTWKPDGAQMGPSGDMGFTWGHYQARSRDLHGEPVLREGRYLSVWKKANGVWKVALDASANDAPAGDCCSLPKP